MAEARLVPSGEKTGTRGATVRRFQLVTTLGKLLNISGDAQFSPKMEGVLKEYVGGTDVQFERKGKDVFEAPPTARLVIACNEVPRVADRSDGIWRRMIVLPCMGKIPEGKRVFGMDRKEWYRDNANMAGILNWALAGLDRLKANRKKFTQPKVAIEAKAGLKGDHNPARLFLAEMVYPCPSADSLPVSHLYAQYSRWCEENGYKRLAANTFSQEVKRVFPKAKGSGPRTVKGVSVRYWSGIQQPPATTDWELGAEVPPDVMFWILHSHGATELFQWFEGGCQGEPPVTAP
jgi:putative DNA primase/helicase